MRDFPISVFHFSNEFVRGGAEEHMLTLLRGLDRRYFRLHLVCTPQCAERLQPDLPADVELLPLCLQKPSQAVAALRLMQILRERRAQILHSHMFYASLFASPIGWVCRVPVIVETPHVREQWRRGWFKSRYFVDRLVGRFVDYYIAVSEANAHYLVEQKGLPAEKMVVIHNGCDLKRIEPFQPAPTGLRSSLGFGEDDPVLTVVGRLEPQKGHEVLLKALVAVRREFPSVRLVSVGEGSLRRDLENLARALGLQDSVRFVGYQNNVPEWLRLANVSVLPSFYEGLPLVAIESLAGGKPMVATAVDGTSEVIVSEKTGLTVPPGDAELLAAAICRLLREPELGAKLGIAGRRWVEEHFSIERQILKTQELYLRAWEQSVKAGGRGFSRECSPLPWGEGGECSEPGEGLVCHLQTFDRSSTCNLPLTRPVPTGEGAGSGIPSPQGRGPRTQFPEPSSLGIQFDETGAGTAPAGLKAAICQTTSQLCAERYRKMLRAIVLTGSLARGEATFVRDGERWRLLGDAEFLLVFDEDGELPSSSVIGRLHREIEHHLLQEGLSAHVELRPAHTRYLRTIPPAIFAYELQTYGQVVWGERQILSLIPAFSPSDIPSEDGWRMLCNRMVEFVEVFEPVLEKPAAPPLEGRYRMIKLYLDMATSFLLFQGAYAPTYRERAERLRALVSSREVESRGVESCSLPFPLRDFAQRVAYCTQLKLQAGDGVDAEPTVGPKGVRPTVEEATPGIFSWAELLTYARGLWRWELERLTGCTCTACRTHFVGAHQVPREGMASRTLTDRELMRRWMQRQPVRKRVRGWVSALRRCGWHRSWRRWPHWVRLGWQASPRYWVYAAASELFFNLDDLLGLAQGPRSDGLDIHKLRSWLPLAGCQETPRNTAIPSVARNLGLQTTALRDCSSPAASQSRRPDEVLRLSAEIAWNYHKFLEGTRA